MDTQAIPTTKVQSMPADPSTPRRGRPEAAAAIWNWRTTDGPGASESSATRLRITGVLQACVGAGVGVAAYLWWSRAVAVVAFAVSSLVLFSALASPTGLYAGIQRLFVATGHFAGRVMTWVVMVPLFYLFFLPFGLLFRRGRRDKLKRYFDRGASTYWETRPAADPASKIRPY